MFGTEPPVPLTPRWNVAPTQTVPVVTEGPRGVRRMEFRRWGLVPSWADDPSIGVRMLNARSETVATKPAFRAAFRSRRCLVPADGFYEWEHVGRAKRPWRFGMRDGGLFAFAGIWERWGKDERAVETMALLTTSPNELCGRVHDRMPVILPPEDWAAWLDPDVRDPDALTPFLRPFDAGRMAAVPVSTYVNDSRHEGPACAAPPEDGAQGNGSLSV